MINSLGHAQMQKSLSFTIEDMEKVAVYRDKYVYDHFGFKKEGNRLVFFEEDKTVEYMRDKDIYLYITDYFENWMNPTVTEVSLFELTTGLKYITYFLGLTE